MYIFWYAQHTHLRLHQSGYNQGMSASGMTPSHVPDSRGTLLRLATCIVYAQAPRLL